MIEPRQIFARQKKRRHSGPTPSGGSPADKGGRGEDNTPLGQTLFTFVVYRERFMPVAVVVAMQWGDEGKGKIVDVLDPAVGSNAITSAG